MVSEDRIEEAIAVGMIQNLNGVHAPDHSSRVKEVVKYGSAPSAPTPHGVFVEFEDGTRFEISVKRL